MTLPQGRINISKCENILELANNSHQQQQQHSNANDIEKMGGLISYPYSVCLKFSPPNKDIYIAAGNYEEITK